MAHRPHNPSYVDAPVTTLADLMRHLHDHPPEYYEPDHASPYHLCCPARLIYPEYTALRKRLMERKRS